MLGHSAIWPCHVPRSCCFTPVSSASQYTLQIKKPIQMETTGLGSPLLTAFCLPLISPFSCLSLWPQRNPCLCWQRAGSQVGITMVSPKMAQNEPKARQGAGGWVWGMCFLREGDLGNKIPAGSALLLSDILSTDRSLRWNLAQSRNRRRWEMVSDVPSGKKPSGLETKPGRCGWCSGEG